MGLVSNYYFVGVRGFPNGIFNPWARWITGLALAKNSSVAAVAVVAAVVALRAKSAKNKLKKWKIKKKYKIKISGMRGCVRLVEALLTRT